MGAENASNFEEKLNDFCENLLKLMKSVWGDTDSDVLQLWNKVIPKIKNNLSISIGKVNESYDYSDFIDYFSDEIKIYNNFFESVQDSRSNLMNLRLFKLAKIILNSLAKFFQGTPVGVCLDILKELIELTKFFHMKPL